MQHQLQPISNHNASRSPKGRKVKNYIQPNTSQLRATKGLGSNQEYGSASQALPSEKCHCPGPFSSIFWGLHHWPRNQPADSSRSLLAVSPKPSSSCSLLHGRSGEPGAREIQETRSGHWRNNSVPQPSWTSPSEVELSLPRKGYFLSLQCFLTIFPVLPLIHFSLCAFWEILSPLSPQRFLRKAFPFFTPSTSHKCLSPLSLQCFPANSFLPLLVLCTKAFTLQRFPQEAFPHYPLDISLQNVSSLIHPALTEKSFLSPSPQHFQRSLFPPFSTFSIFSHNPSLSTQHLAQKPRLPPARPGKTSPPLLLHFPLKKKNFPHYSLDFPGKIFPSPSPQPLRQTAPLSSDLPASRLAPARANEALLPPSVSRLNASPLSPQRFPRKAFSPSFP